MAVLAAAALVFWTGRKGLAADFIGQASWHLLFAQETAEGIGVATAGKNLMLLPGVRVKADSEESSAFSADWVRDGVNDEENLRWSSENDWEDTEHWLAASFREPVTVGVVRIFWERTNAKTYALEYSSDGKNWITAASFDAPPEERMQDIVLSEPVEAQYIRLHVMEVTKEEEDLSLYYQNISILELEIYEGIEDRFLIEKPSIPSGSWRRLCVSAADGGEDSWPVQVQTTALPEVPEGYSLEFIGADYEMLVQMDGRISHTIADTEAELGFLLIKDGVGHELPGMRVTIPASVSWQGDGQPAAEGGLPEGYSVMEWRPQGGSFSLTRETRVVLPEEHREKLYPTAALFAGELSENLGRSVEVVCIKAAGDNRYEMAADDIYLTFAQDYAPKHTEQWTQQLGEEGYEIGLQTMRNGGVQILAETLQGMRWGCVSFLSLLEKSKGVLPQGSIRDYPRYPVRGFGIDVGRRPVSLELLYRMVEEMSAQKMNTLQVHLNDNQIISQSDYDSTAEGARTLYAGFRLESDMKNEAGMGITSSDLYYTKEAFAQFIADAALYGVEVVPEIDTPAHSLALTKVFPKLGLSKNPESADQLDLSNPKAIQLGKDLWKEYLTADGEMESPVFEGCRAVHIGMDEYFGKENAYLSYLKELTAYVRQLAPEKKIRIWGSLSKMEGDHSGLSQEVQMHIWDTDWADPEEMYEQGFAVINSLSSSLYIIPGGGYDWLDQEFLEQEWQPNIFHTTERTWELPAYSEKMLGACYMMWNDWAQVNGESITEEDLFARFAKPLPVIAQKLWGSAKD